MPEPTVPPRRVLATVPDENYRRARLYDQLWRFAYSRPVTLSITGTHDTVYEVEVGGNKVSGNLGDVEAFIARMAGQDEPPSASGQPQQEEFDLARDLISPRGLQAVADLVARAPSQFEFTSCEANTRSVLVRVTLDRGGPEANVDALQDLLELAMCSEALVKNLVHARQEADRLRAICVAHDADPEGCVECFQADIEGRPARPLPHGITPLAEHGRSLADALRAASEDDVPASGEPQPDSRESGHG